MTRNKCKNQYTGQTTDHFRSRQNNYMSKSRGLDRGGHCLQKHFHKYFESERHSGFRDDVSVILIDKYEGSNSTKRETYWMGTLKTIAPYGLNAENAV